MAASKRYPTDYPGVYYKMAQRLTGKGQEKVYYCTYKVNGKKIEVRLAYHKLKLLARMVDFMGDDRYRANFEGNDFFALHLFLSDIKRFNVLAV